MGDLRAKALAAVLAKHIPGNPTILFQYMPGGGGRKAANHLYNTARADGLTLFRISSSIVPYAVLGEPGVQYDVDKLIYLGTTEHMLYKGQSSRFSLESLESRRSTPFERSSSSIRAARITDSTPRNYQSRRFRQCIHDGNKGKTQCSYYDVKSLYQYLSSTDLGLRRKESTAGDLRSAGHSRGRRPYVLRAGLFRTLPPSCDLRGQDPKRS
jgi:hypothetical protein